MATIKTVMVTSLLIFCSSKLLHAQINNPTKTAKDKSQQRANNRIDEHIDRGLDKLDEGLGSIFKKKNKNRDGNESQTNSETSEQSNFDAPRTGHQSKFDFEPGNKILFQENFDRVAIGDFPADFNTNASGEVVTLPNKQGKWLAMTQNGNFLPEYIQTLPNNFTLEFDLGIDQEIDNNMTGVEVIFTTNKEDLMRTDMFELGTSVIALHPGAQMIDMNIRPKNGGDDITNQIKMPQWNSTSKRFCHVSLWRQNGRLRVYVDESKLIDAPRFFEQNNGQYSLSYARRFFGDCIVYIGNIRCAAAGADNRTKLLLSEGRFSTTEILFDINSDKIKPQSNTIIAEIGQMLANNPNLKIKIIGHTDSDGEASANLILSKKRAESVKNRICENYTVDVSRILCEGKGESQALNNNQTEQEKAQNRRVEFIKL